MPKIQAQHRAPAALLRLLVMLLIVATNPVTKRAETPTLVFNRGSLPFVESPPVSPQARTEDKQVRIERYTVRRGDSLLGIYSRFGGNSQGFPHSEVSRHPVLLRIGTEIRIERNQSDGSLLALRIPFSPREELILERSHEPLFRVFNQARQHEEIERVVSGTITQSFFTSARSEGVPVEIIDAVVDALSSKLEFQTELKLGASFKLLFLEHRDPDGEFLEAGPLLAAVFENGNQVFTAVRSTLSGPGATYLDEKGLPLDSGFLRYPLHFTRISSLYSKARFHPIHKKKRPHNGVDFAAPIGTPVRAVADGVVKLAARRGAAGLMVKIEHDSRYATAYLHLHTLAKGLRPGERVSRGQIIGTVGMSGSATGPHLHYELYENGRFVNPLTTPLAYQPEVVRAKPQHVTATLARLTHALTMQARASKTEKEIA